MSKRIDPSWEVFASIENREHDRCVDLFQRPDGSFGFETFRRDPEDGGAWTPTGYYSVTSHPTGASAMCAAESAVVWLAERLRADPDLRESSLAGRD